jgi:hypothetical protein
MSWHRPDATARRETFHDFEKEMTCMSAVLKEDAGRSAGRSYRVVLSAVRNLPDRCALNVGELADQIGADKLDLLRWVRADLEFAYLIASKVTT